MKQIFKTVIVVLSLTIVTSCNANSKTKAQDLVITETKIETKLKTENPEIKVALLLDTSNSMDGLIDQAKAQLWKIVNELSYAKCDEKSPNLKIALYEYGNDNLNADEGYLRQVISFSDDLDEISKSLFSLTTNGGNEYCGAVIKTSLKELDWSSSPKDLKLMIIAGNEPFDQGPVDFRNFCNEAKSSGIQINTIFCGDYNEGKSVGWMEGAHIAEGKYLNIDQDQKVTHIPTPYDQKIIDLNIKLNKTYIGYGQRGAEKMRLQSTQDANAGSYGAANMRSRAAVKAKKSYNNASWDLVDAVEENESILGDIGQLPSEMKAMNKDERVEFVKAKSAERSDIQKEILELETKAKKYEMAERAKIKEDKGTLDDVLIEAVKSQAVEKKFKFKK